MDIQELQYVITLGETLNFNKAAAALYISQPALSQRIKRLEERLQVTLFYRNRTQVLLTPAGQAFIEKARPILAACKALEEKMGTFATTNEIYRLGISQFYGRHLLGPILSLLKEKAPTYTLQIQEAESHDLEKQLIKGEIDGAIFPAPIYQKELAFLPLYTEELLLALPKKTDHPSLQRSHPTTTIAITDYRTAPFILLKKGLKLRERVEQLCFSYGFTPYIAFETENIDTVASLVALSYGAAIVPNVPAICHHPQLCLYHLSHPLAQRLMGLAYLPLRMKDDSLPFLLQRYLKEKIQ